MKRLIGAVAVGLIICGNVSEIDAAKKNSNYKRTARMKELEKNPEVQEYIQEYIKQNGLGDSDVQDSQYDDDQGRIKNILKKFKKKKRTAVSDDDEQSFDEDARPRRASKKRRKSKRDFDEDSEDQVSNSRSYSDRSDDENFQSSSNKSGKKKRKASAGKKGSKKKKDRKAKRRAEDAWKYEEAFNLNNVEEGTIVNEPTISNISESSMVVSNDVNSVKPILDASDGPLPEVLPAPCEANTETILAQADIETDINERMARVKADRQTYNLIKKPKQDVEKSLQGSKFRDELDYYRQRYLSGVKKLQNV